MTPPTLHTARLVLRPATMADFAAHAAFVTGPRRDLSGSACRGGPHDAATAWSRFCNDTAQPATTQSHPFAGGPDAR